MATKPTEEFAREAVRVALTSGLPRKQVAADLGIGLSALGKRVNRFEDETMVPDADHELALENEWLRREIKALRDEREIQKKRRSSSRATEAMNVIGLSEWLKDTFCVY